MTIPSRLAFLVDTVELGSPAQQLLDRLHLGYPRGGGLYRPRLDALTLFEEKPGSGDWHAVRKDSGGPERAADLESAIAGADLVVVASSTGTPGSLRLLEKALGHLRARHRVFLLGSFGHDVARARELAQRVREIGCAFSAGTVFRALGTLPALTLPLESSGGPALVAAPGPRVEAFEVGLEMLARVVSRGVPDPEGLSILEGERVHALLEDDPGPVQRLARAAFSRSHSPRGGAVTDGRTEDVLARGRFRELVKDPWLVRLTLEREGRREVSWVLGVEGILGDRVFAVEDGGGKLTSGQLFLPPEPAEHGYSSLASGVEDFLLGGPPPGSLEQGLDQARLVEALRLHEDSRED